MSQPRAYNHSVSPPPHGEVLGVPDNVAQEKQLKTKTTSGINFWKLGKVTLLVQLETLKLTVNFVRKIRWVLMSIAVFWLAIFD